MENRSVSYVSAPNDFTSFAPLIVSCRWDESPPVISWALTLVRRSFLPNRAIGQKASGKTTRATQREFPVAVTTTNTRNTAVRCP